ncbi:DNA repair protein RecN [Baekduia sp. Peel2402]|uniref:DNA repair protein RecN n=1 Tax=Baekduia sp. Peel2402 TaxID=3458296 RepID=UPI00403E7FDC
MLHELRVENLLLIERAELCLAPGLNVLTGETGAGKTVLAHALDLLLGGRAKAGIVRPGAAEAYVEGVFDLPSGLRSLLGDLVAPDADELVLSRRVSSEGRTRAYMNGRSVPVADLRAAAEGLIAFYGQHEHRKLTLASSQLELLDGACGDAQAARRDRYAALHARVRSLEGSLDELRERAGARDRELDLLQFELAEIDAAAPSEDEEASLVAQRDRLRHVEALRDSALGAAEAIVADEGGVSLALASGASLLDALDGVDAQLDTLTARWHALAIEADDLAAELRSYGEGMEDDDAAGLDVIEERLAAWDRLKRKHGGTIATVLAHADECRARIAELDDAEVALEDAQAALAAALSDRASLAAELHGSRVKAAKSLAKQVRARLADLAMESASFEISIEPRDAGPTGVDAVEFLIAPNPGVPAAPLRETASGGELSRVMLALLGAANATGSSILVFDEIDAGIGGHTARAVGSQLRDLAAGRQVLCITHLPQVASLATRHFSISKSTSNSTTLTTVTQLPEKSIVSELVRMLGAPTDDVAARRHAKELRKAA